VAQTVPLSEILVVDNDPSNVETGKLVRDEFPTVRYVMESVPGLDFARNRALLETSKEIVAFIDDDVVTDPDWAETLQSVFSESQKIAICTGKVRAYSLKNEGQRLFEANGGFARGDKRIHLPDDRSQRLGGMKAPLIAWSISIGSGCSLAVRRTSIINLGGFDEALDMGKILPGGGDLDIIWRALDEGYEVVYEPTVKARHEHRSDYNDSVNQIIQHNRSLIAMLTKAVIGGRFETRINIIAFLIWRLIKPGVRISRKLAGRDPLPLWVLFRLWWNCWRGLGSYLAARRIAARRRSMNHA